jgi:hypothetical protein
MEADSNVPTETTLSEEFGVTSYLDHPCTRTALMLQEASEDGHGIPDWVVHYFPSAY